MAPKCDAKVEVYSRVCGFFRPVQQWNKGKKEEFRDRREFLVEQSGAKG
ncbi:anaerobic ribonucleoside-triphosphate reductase [Geoalkalibacter halelectricus]|uniref:Anaerobic ribonucleoside-triphosphate reductase n=1 Tax=Geoalkalibacter halelectricus TaxID=2847045 RepID=A0ABY5ZU63_9BACT|nr:anaerobic ribonucleoside-triphosphate reductase [Geoalkalibacter halelectricus]UWZ80751.1 anaerobic ribonucleoside-triphosphate reductase [Geoalkalibacter halelectricus]